MTLTYVYADQTAVLGPLATYAEPHAYDLCEQHSERLSAPRGWEVLRLAGDPVPTGPSEDDLLALADAVREAAVRPSAPVPGPRRLDDDRSGPVGAPPPLPGRPPEPPRRRARDAHLRLLTNDPG